jgi:hypothetical protein
MDPPEGLTEAVGGPALQRQNAENLNFETNHPRKGILGYQSQFPHSCVCEPFIYFYDGSAYSAGGNTVCGPILGIYEYKSLTDT